MISTVDGSENIPRWMVSSAANMIQNGGCPYPITDIRLPPPNRDNTPNYIEMLFVGPSAIIPNTNNDPKIYSLIVQLICTAIRNETNIYWLEQLQGWAQRLLADCFQVKSNPMVEAIGDTLVPIQKTGNSSLLGQSNLDGNKIVDTIGPFTNLNRSTVTAVYKWEYAWNDSLASVL